MIPSVFLTGSLASSESKTIQGKEGETPSNFRVYNFTFDCYVPEIDATISYSKIKKPNHQQYILLSDAESLQMYDSIPKGNPCSFKFAIFPKLSNGRAKLRLVLQEFKPA